MAPTRRRTPRCGCTGRPVQPPRRTASDRTPGGSLMPTRTGSRRRWRPTRRRDGRRRLWTVGVGGATPGGGVGRGRTDADRDGHTARLAVRLRRRPVLATAAVAGSVAIVVDLAAGLVAAVIAAVYVATGAVVYLARQRSVAHAVAFRDALDAVGAIAADLRAGADPASAMACSRDELSSGGDVA